MKSKLHNVKTPKNTRHTTQCRKQDNLQFGILSKHKKGIKGGEGEGRQIKHLKDSLRKRNERRNCTHLFVYIRVQMQTLLLQ